jgi:hypothetical protein
MGTPEGSRTIPSTRCAGWSSSMTTRYRTAFAELTKSVHRTAMAIARFTKPLSGINSTPARNGQMLRTAITLIHISVLPSHAIVYSHPSSVRIVARLGVGLRRPLALSTAASRFIAAPQTLLYSFQLRGRLCGCVLDTSAHD